MLTSVFSLKQNQGLRLCDVRSATNGFSSASNVSCFEMNSKKEHSLSVVQTSRYNDCLWLDGRGCRILSPGGDRFLSSPSRPHRYWVPPSLPSNRYRGFFPWRIKRPGREADHSPPYTVEVKNNLIYTSTPLYVFMAQYLIS
jgi:hypothetical protein